VTVEPNETRAVRLFVTARADDDNADNLPALFTLKSGDLTVQAKSTFLSGAANHDSRD
jgi:hypothetical protein